jgi:hypothetical protein
MQRPESTSLRFALIAAAAVAACGGSSPSEDGTVNCQTDSRVMTYAPNLAATAGSGMKYILVQSNPAPPAKGTDTWTIRVTDPAGTPQPSLSLQIKTLMPDHGHGSSVTPTISNQGSGNYQVNNLFLFMPGVWKITFSTTTAPTDTADFWFCVPG